MGYTFEEIRDRIKDRLQNPTSTIEGTFSMDNAQAVAQELARIHNMEIEPLLDAAFLDTAAGENLDRRAMDFNETRRQAAASTGKLKFTGSDGTYIPMGFTAASAALSFETTAAARIGANGEAMVNAVCRTPGSVGNVASGAVGTLISAVPGVESVTNPQAFEGGADIESDQAFRARLLEKIRKPITSGNENHYVYWAKQVSGVGNARCFGTWNGPGTVKVTIISDTGGVPDDTLVERVKSYILENKPIGAELTVAKAQPLPINIEGTLILASGHEMDAVVQAAKDGVAAYLAQIAFLDTAGTTQYLSYHKIGELIFSTPGVNDLRDLLLNGQTSTIEIGPEEFCRLGEVDLHA